jgi:hypothetical protein
MLLIKQDKYKHQVLNIIGLLNSLVTGTSDSISIEKDIELFKWLKWRISPLIWSKDSKNTVFSNTLLSLAKVAIFNFEKKFSEEIEKYKKYEEKQRRQCEVDVLNNLGFIIDYGTVIENDDTRDATDIECYFWSCYDTQTPKVPILYINDDIDITELDIHNYTEAMFSNCIQYNNMSFIWLSNNKNYVLFIHQDGVWIRKNVFYNYGL